MFPLQPNIPFMNLSRASNRENLAWALGAAYARFLIYSGSCSLSPLSSAPAPLGSIPLPPPLALPMLVRPAPLRYVAFRLRSHSLPLRSDLALLPFRSCCRSLSCPDSAPDCSPARFRPLPRLHLYGSGPLGLLGNMRLLYLCFQCNAHTAPRRFQVNTGWGRRWRPCSNRRQLWQTAYGKPQAKGSRSSL